VPGIIAMDHVQPSLGLLTLMLGVASLCDVRARRIPNWIVVPIAVTGLLSQYMHGGLKAAAGGLLALAIVVTLLLVLWARRALGGGDLKLAAAAATWVGLASLPLYAATSCIVGGLVALYCYFESTATARQEIRANLSRFHAPTIAEARRTAGSPVLVPYGVAFAVGALVTLWAKGRT
jgi:prepilin peptidase CpaA